MKVEVVANWRGHIPNDEFWHAPAEMDNEKRPKRRVLYEFYNILWVGWKGGVVYRRAHGRVERRCWMDWRLKLLIWFLDKT